MNLVKKYSERLQTGDFESYESLLEEMMSEIREQYDILDVEDSKALAEMVRNPPPLPDWLKEVFKAKKADPGTPEALKPYWDIVKVVEEECGNTDGRIHSSVHGIIRSTIQNALKKHDAVIIAAKAIPTIHMSTCWTFCQPKRECNCVYGQLRKALESL